MTYQKVINQIKNQDRLKFIEDYDNHHLDLAHDRFGLDPINIYLTETLFKGSREDHLDFIGGYDGWLDDMKHY